MSGPKRGVGENRGNEGVHKAESRWGFFCSTSWKRLPVKA